jgi:hypothetical protein
LGNVSNTKLAGKFLDRLDSWSDENPLENSIQVISGPLICYGSAGDGRKDPSAPHEQGWK